jgi:rRNA processing protein Krr1/Pno1
MNFVIDKADPNLSIITTKPLVGGQFFELWRKDNVGGYNRAMSSLHTIQRIVELGFNENQGQVCIVCKVTIERLSIPEKKIDSAASTYSMFSRSSESEQSLSLNEEQESQMEWIDIGRDNRLETVILNKIDKKITGKKGGR